MILNHDYKFIFICNGKTGTSSIESALAPYQQGENFEVGVSGLYQKRHIPPSVLRALLGLKVWDEYFTFSFVRNPWDWFVSSFFWNHKPNPIHPKGILTNPLRTARLYFAKRKKEKRLRELQKFSADDVYSTYDLLKQYRGIYEADSLFQYHYVFSPNGEKLVDFVGRFESLETDFSEILDRLGISAELPVRNKSKLRRSYQSYFTEETRRLIGQLYHVDVETFDYSFEESSTAKIKTE